MTHRTSAQRRVDGWLVVAAIAASLLGTTRCNEVHTGKVPETSIDPPLGASVAPRGFQVSQVPQFVSITFDDNFSTEGMDWAIEFFHALHNPLGNGQAETFDATPVRSTFPVTCAYQDGRLETWERLHRDGHELANHTATHEDGTTYKLEQWNQEIAKCNSELAKNFSRVVPPVRLIGFRAPYLRYADSLFGALVENQFAYDTSIMGCWADSQDGSTCSWPYTMNAGSLDADAMYQKWPAHNLSPIGIHPDLWEVPVGVAIVPDDSLAGQYGFRAGLRQRVDRHLTGAPNPNFFEASTGKMAAMDITMIQEAQMTRDEALATLKHTLDLRLAGNRAPLVFVAHTHVYASFWDPETPSIARTADRRAIIQDFVNYALSKPEVRIRPVADIVTWMKNPVAFDSSTRANP